MNLCECGCGQRVSNRFAFGHHARTAEVRRRLSEAHTGKKFTPAHRANISTAVRLQARVGERSAVWKGDQVGYKGLHMWVSTLR